MNIKSEFRILRRNIFEIFGNHKYSRPSLNNLDKKLNKYLDFKNGFFIEVGGNDGYTQSNTYYLEKILNWRGILVEGIPSLYRQCQRIRKKSLVYNYALVASDFDQPFIEMHYANLMSVVEGSLKDEKTQKEHLEAGLECQNLKDKYTIKVPTRTLESILDNIPNLPKIDFLSLDVEGYEANVLFGLNLEKYQPKYILVEARFFDEVNSVLQPYYEIIEKLSYHDYLYCLKK
jgi:FkbM family methyltransferase